MPLSSRVTRRALLQAGAGLALAVAAEPAAAHRPPTRPWRPAHDDDWPLPAHDLAATRAGERLRGARVRWRATFAGGVPASAALAGGAVHVASAAGEVAALALADGRERWRRTLGTASYGSGADRRELGFFAGVALAGRRMLVASDRLFCLDAAGGATVCGSRSRCARRPATTTTGDCRRSSASWCWSAPAPARSCRRRAAASTPTGCATGRCCGAPRRCRRAPTAAA